MNDTTIDAVLRKSKELRAAGRYLEAIELLTEAIRDNTNARLYFSRGRLFHLVDQPEEAVADFTRAIELDSNSAQYYFDRGSTLSYPMQRDNEAIEDFEKGLELEPDNHEAHRDCSLCLLKMGKPNRAWEHAQAALELAPNDATTHFCVGQAQMSLDQIGDAVESFTRAVELDPEQSHHWAALGSARRALGTKTDLELAEVAYSRAIQLSPDSASYFGSRGHLRLRLGIVDDAIADLRRALTLNPNKATKMLVNIFLEEANKQSQ